MAELHTTSTSIFAVLASSEACDRVPTPVGVTLMRTAPREVLLVGTVDTEAIRGALDEPGAIVDDVTDGWAAFRLAGVDARDAFARVCELQLPAGGWVQGEVAHAAAKIIIAPDGLTILVPAMLGSHVEERIRADAEELLEP